MRGRGTRLGVLAVAALAAGPGAVDAGGVALPPAAQGPLRIAYTAGAQTPAVYVADVDGSHRRRLGVGSQPLIAPDGQLVAAAKYAPHGAALEIWSVTGGAPHGYYDLSKFGAQPLAWSPDSRYLAVALFSTTSDTDPHQGLAVIDTTTGTTKTIAHGFVAGASFAPALPYRLAYGLYAHGKIFGPADIYSTGPDGTGRVQLTHDHRSLDPLWGPTKIAFDHERLRGLSSGPAYQIWLMAPDGSGRAQLTHVPVPALIVGLVPFAFSADGERLAARYEGEDTSDAYTIQVASGRTRELKVRGQPVVLDGLSLDGSTVLVDVGGLENPPSAGTIETLPFNGGRPKVLIRHAAAASWNR